MKEREQQELIDRACDLLGADILRLLDVYEEHQKSATTRNEPSMMSMDMLSMLSTFANLVRAQ